MKKGASNQRNLLLINISFKKRGERSHVGKSPPFFFFRYIIPCQESPQIQRKDGVFFFAEAWNSADLLMMKASLPLFAAMFHSIAPLFGSLLC